MSDDDEGDEEYPLFCFSGTVDDVFSGWFAVSDTNQCNDFCFWDDQGNDIVSMTANPHQTVELVGQDDRSHWGCIHNAAGDDKTWKNSYPLFQEYEGSTFPHLRCSRGVREELDTWQKDWTKSEAFWSILMTLCFVIFITELFYFLRRRRRRIIQEEQEGDCDVQNVETAENVAYNKDRVSKEEDTDQESQANNSPESDANAMMILASLSVATTEESEQTERSIPWKKYGWRLLMLLVVMINVVLVFILFMSILSLLEIRSNVDLPFNLKVMTPECTPSDSICPDGDVDLNKPSTKRTAENTFSFSYLLASDPQLDWYNGEASNIGKSNYPPPCSSKDSCASCTDKFGSYANAQMKLALETLIKGGEARRAINDGPTPKTLVVNGDLTSYFHRREIQKFESFFHNIDGLENYFPSLGNHDYDHQDGATFDGDEWLKPHNCNAEHALLYFKSAFCNKVPNFRAKEQITRYDSNSLAYSWEEGSYHFVHLHYHPYYENARIGISNSLIWLNQDLKLATEANLTNILFVHSARHLSTSIEKILVDNNVRAIFAAHEHRCFGPKCTKLSTLDEDEVAELLNSTDVNAFEGTEKCFPAGAELCGSAANGRHMSLFSLNDMDEDLILSNRKLYTSGRSAKGPCPVSSRRTFINETDNTLLCRKKTDVQSTFPFSKGGGTPTSPDERQIPIFWTGSSSFETFILVDFHPDKFVLNFMTAGSGVEGSRYIDVNQVPNAIYPLHNVTDLQELTIHI